MGTGPPQLCVVLRSPRLAQRRRKFRWRAGGVYKASLAGALLTPLENPLLILHKRYLRLLTYQTFSGINWRVKVAHLYYERVRRG